jgi:signal transduction histidine kinase
MLLSVSFSAGVYQQVASSTERALIFHERKIDSRLKDFGIDRMDNPPPQFQKIINEETAKDILDHTLVFLIVMNFLILVLSGGLGYFLAGKTLAPIENMVDKQKKFVADAAHEIKTPLTAMKTMLEVQMRNRNLNVENAKQSMGDVLEEVDSLALLTARLLDESKYQNSPVVFEKIFLNELFDSVLKKFDEGIKAKNLFISKDFTDDLFIKGDKKSIRELLSILIDNAVKFNVDGGKIDIKGQILDKNQIVFTISNAGEGIAEKDLNKIFDRFYKASKSRTRKNDSGYGLGLSIAKEIVEKHDGNISVESDKDETSFSVVLLSS